MNAAKLPRRIPWRKDTTMQKQMEYTVKLITNGPVDPDSLEEVILRHHEVVTAEIVNFRVLPKPKAVKVEAGQ